MHRDLPNSKQDLIEIPKNLLIPKPQNEPPKTKEFRIPPSILSLPPLMASAIHLDDEARFRSREIDDEIPNHELTPKGKTTPRSRNPRPKKMFGRSGRKARRTRPLPKHESLMRRDNRSSKHSHLPKPPRSATNTAPKRRFRAARNRRPRHAPSRGTERARQVFVALRGGVPQPATRIRPSSRPRASSDRTEP